ncbi:MAG TPA: BatA and WFA domain-containing protein [Gemmatimonadales bacterium]|nr:BatA and WFA domain-containing protein [Gemmatimonadales bacterium]
MTFLFPWVLVGLAAAAIPILLHLVERRQPPERAFPAVRYLEDATRDQRRRLKFRHLLLLALRTLLVVLVVLAAAGARLHRAVPLGAHTPMALVLILDNSASSGAVMDGEPTIEALRTTARAVLERATPSDRLWLLLADGVARPGTAKELLARLETVQVIPDRLELGQAVRQADALIRNAGRRGEVVVVSDAQRSAVSPVEVAADMIVLRPAAVPPRNRAIAVLEAGNQPWGGQGGRVAVQVVAEDTAAVAARLTAGNSPPRDLLLTPGVPSTQRIVLGTPGWHLIEVSLPADELRLDDTRQVAVQVARPAGVTWSSRDRFLDAALRVLIGERRLLEGGGASIGRLGAGPSIVVPPEDPALLGALNRALEARGSSWRYGDVVTAPAQSDSTGLLPERVAVERAVRLVPSAGGRRADTVVTVGGEPWIVRSGDLVLVGSRFEPTWTDLPVRAGFVPLLDALASRVVHGAPALPSTLVGGRLPLPPRVTRVVGAGVDVGVEGGSTWSPPAPGNYWLLAGLDTIGAISTGIDPRESALARATSAELEEAWPGAVVADLTDGASRTFAAGGRGDLRPLLLLLALLTLIGESLVAGRIGRVR